MKGELKLGDVSMMLNVWVGRAWVVDIDEALLIEGYVRFGGIKDNKGWKMEDGGVVVGSQDVFQLHRGLWGIKEHPMCYGFL